MRKYHVVTENEKQQEALRELAGFLDFVQGENGTEVLLKKQGDRISVTKENDRWTVCYGKDSELARAWFLMYRNDDKQSVSITEKSSFEELGVMLDCSRNAVMKVDTVKEYIKLLALMGYQTLELYTEDTLKVEGEPYFGYMRGAYSREEIQEIDRYCRIFGMELVPCIQTLAHVNQIVRYEHYQKFTDVNDILLVGDERTYELLEHIIASAAKAFTSRRINIGMDEAHMLGLGKYLDEHGYQERFPIMVEHLKRVQEILKKYGFKAQMWSDMFFRLLGKGEYTLSKEQMDEALLRLVPKDVELIYWDYYSRDYEHYNQNIKNHYLITDRIGFAAGAWKWTGFAPDNQFSQTAGAAAMKACLDNHVGNFLVTCWGDNGAEASAFSVLPTLFFYAEAAYSGNVQETIRTIKDRGFRYLAGIDFDEFMKIDSPNQLFPVTDYEHGNACKYFLYNDPLIGTFDNLAGPSVTKLLEDRSRELQSLAENSGRYGYLFDTLSELCRVLQLKADLGVRIKAAYDVRDMNTLANIAGEIIPEVITRLDAFIQKFRYQWHKENKSFGFEIQLIRLGGLKERLLYVKEQLLFYEEGRIDRIDELEDERLPFAYFEEKDPCMVNYNLWNVIASPAVMG